MSTNPFREEPNFHSYRSPNFLCGAQPIIPATRSKMTSSAQRAFPQKKTSNHLILPFPNHHEKALSTPTVWSHWHEDHRRHCFLCYRCIDRLVFAGNASCCCPARAALPSKSQEFSQSDSLPCICSIRDSYPGTNFQ
jgi:hypothetical protein